MKVIRSTKPTFNVRTDTDERHFNLDSNFQAVIRLQDTGTGTLTLTVGPPYSSVAIAHGLGYIPYYQVFARLRNTTTGVTTNYVNITGIWSSVAANAYAQAFIDGTSLYVQGSKVSGVQTVFLDYRYYIGRDPIQ